MGHIRGLKGTLLKWMRDYLKAKEMRTLIRDTYSSWSNVASGVPQGSVLAPIMFQTYINDIQKCLINYVHLFADVAKLLRVIKRHADCMKLERDLNKIYDGARDDIWISPLKNVM